MSDRKKKHIYIYKNRFKRCEYEKLELQSIQGKHSIQCCIDHVCTDVQYQFAAHSRNFIGYKEGGMEKQYLNMSVNCVQRWLILEHKKCLQKPCTTCKAISV